jgi:hypothetical protein
MRGNWEKMVDRSHSRMDRKLSTLMIEMMWKVANLESVSASRQNEHARPGETGETGSAQAARRETDHTTK